MRHNLYTAAALAAAFVTMTAMHSYAQEARSTVSGTITDQSGAAVVGAALEVAGQDEADTARTEIDEQGMVHLETRPGSGLPVRGHPSTLL